MEMSKDLLSQAYSTLSFADMQDLLLDIFLQMFSFIVSLLEQTPPAICYTLDLICSIN